MSKVILEFKAKVVTGRFYFPSLGRRHVVEGLGGNGAVMKYSNSNMFEEMLNQHLRKELRLPVGLHCWVGDLLPVSPWLSVVKEGYFYTFRLEFEDAR